MSDELYNKLLEILTLGHLSYIDDYGGTLRIEEVALFCDLRDKYSTEGYSNVVREFIYWHKSLKDSESRE